MGGRPKNLYSIFGRVRDSSLIHGDQMNSGFQAPYCAAGIGIGRIGRGA